MALLQQVGHLHLEDEPDERQHQRGDEDPLVGRHDGHGPPQPGERLVRVDGGPGRLVAGLLGDGDELGAGLGGTCRCRPDGGRAVLIGPRSGPAGEATSARRHSAEAVEGPLGVGRVVQVAGDVAQPGVDGARRRRRAPGALAVSTWSTRRRSPSTVRRSTRPRPTSPSTTAVTLGGRTARRSARSEESGRGPLQQAEDPVLGQRQVDGAQADLDLLGQPGGRPAQRLAVVGPRAGPGQLL